MSDNEEIKIIPKGKIYQIGKLEENDNIVFNRDDNEYIVERKIGTGPYHRLFIKGEKEGRLEGKEPVVAKVKELSGILSNEKNIYQNVITAYQNKIVDVFNETPAERARIFNQVFEGPQCQV